MNRKHLVLFLLVLIALMGGAFWQRFIATPVVSVRIKNATATPITALTVIIRGENPTVAVLAPGKSITVDVKPKGESDLAISFVDATGATNLANADVYLESNYRGDITATIGLSNTVSWTGTDRVRPYY